MIRNVVVHIANEQPLLADLFDLPAASDAGLLCTNLRAVDGKRPVFIDRIESTFFFPYRAIRFLEIPAGALERHRDEDGRAVSAGPVPADAPAGAERFETRLPAVIAASAGDEADPGDDDAELGDEIDDDFLRRIREV